MKTKHNEVDNIKNNNKGMLKAKDNGENNEAGKKNKMKGWEKLKTMNGK